MADFRISFFVHLNLFLLAGNIFNNLKIPVTLHLTRSQWAPDLTDQFPLINQMHLRF